MKTAREAATSIVRAMGYTRPSAIELHVRRVLPLLEARDREWMEACARADRIRALIPKEDSRG